MRMLDRINKLTIYCNNNNNNNRQVERHMVRFIKETNNNIFVSFINLKSFPMKIINQMKINNIIAVQLVNCNVIFYVNIIMLI
jgi:hypothetical protein